MENTNSEKTERLLTDREVAAMLGVSEGYIRNGGVLLPFVKIGRSKRTKLSDVLHLIEQRTITTKRVMRPDGEVEEIDLRTGRRELVSDEAPAAA